MTTGRMFRPLVERLRECTCDDAYTKRKLSDPTCQFHSGLHDEAADEIDRLLDENVQLYRVVEALKYELRVAYLMSSKLAKTIDAYQTISPN